MFAVTYTTESGDEGFVGVFSEEPTDGHLSAIAKRDFPWEVVEDGDEIFMCMSFQVYPVTEIKELPEPIDPIDGP